jgi:hypothetical protein
MAAADVEYRCFVGGLAWATNNETLEQAFANFGQVIDSKVCFVSFRSRWVLIPWPLRGVVRLDPCCRSIDLPCFGPDLRSLESYVPSDAAAVM